MRSIKSIITIILATVANVLLAQIQSVSHPTVFSDNQLTEVFIQAYPNDRSLPQGQPYLVAPVETTPFPLSIDSTQKSLVHFFHGGESNTWRTTYSWNTSSGNEYAKMPNLASMISSTGPTDGTSTQYPKLDQLSTNTTNMGLFSMADHPNYSSYTNDQLVAVPSISFNGMPRDPSTFAVKNPWTYIYNGIDDALKISSSKVVTVNHTEHANYIRNKLNSSYNATWNSEFSTYAWIYDTPSYMNLEESQGPGYSTGFWAYNLRLPEEIYLYENKFETENYLGIQDNLGFWIQDDNSNDLLIPAYYPRDFGFSYPMYLNYQRWNDWNETPEVFRFTYNLGESWHAYWSFVTLNIMNIDGDGDTSSTVDWGPIVWPENEYLDERPDGTFYKNTRGVRFPDLVNASIGGTDYLYVFYSEVTQDPHYTPSEINFRLYGFEYSSFASEIKVARNEIADILSNDMEFEYYIGGSSWSTYSPPDITPVGKTGQYDLREWLDMPGRALRSESDNVTDFKNFMKSDLSSNSPTNPTCSGFTGMFKSEGSQSWTLDVVYPVHEDNVSWTAIRHPKKFIVTKTTDGGYLGMLVVALPQDDDMDNFNSGNGISGISFSDMDTAILLTTSTDLVSWTKPVLILGESTSRPFPIAFDPRFLSDTGLSTNLIDTDAFYIISMSKPINDAQIDLTSLTQSGLLSRSVHRIGLKLNF